MNKRLPLIIGCILTTVGIIGILPTLYYQTRNHVVASQLQEANNTDQSLPPVTQFSGKPVELTIPNLGLKLQVTDGVYNSQTAQWTLSNDKAHYALLTPQPNDNSGNTLIYGHYRPEVFARLHNIRVGEEVVVTTNNGYRFVYVYRSTKAVNPADTSVFSYGGAPKLTLQTCSGAWMQNRQLYEFTYIRYEKI